MYELNVIDFFGYSRKRLACSVFDFSDGVLELTRVAIFLSGITALDDNDPVYGFYDMLTVCWE